MENYQQIIDEMDHKMMRGAEASPDLYRVLSALRLCVKYSADSLAKKSERIMEMREMIEQTKDQTHATIEEEQRICREVCALQASDHQRDIKILRRQMGIWRAKAKRLESEKGES
jgi:hypothetical protein